MEAKKDLQKLFQMQISIKIKKIEQANERMDKSMEENVAKFEEKLKELVELGKKKKKFSKFRRSAIFCPIWNYLRSRWKKYMNIWKR